MVTKEQFIEYINAMDKEKRIEGIVTELFFEKILADKIIKHLSFGWMYGERDEQRKWFKLLNKWPLDEIDKKIIKALHNNMNEIFLVWCKNIFQENGKLQLEFSLVRANMNDEKLSWQKDENMSWGYNKSINERLSKVNTDSPNGQIGYWLDKQNEQTVRHIFLNRCLMDFVGRKIDVDAICLNNGPLEFVEFKRKDPAAGRYIPDTVRSYDEYTDLFHKLEDIVNRINEKRARTDKIQSVNFTPILPPVSLLPFHLFHKHLSRRFTFILPLFERFVKRFREMGLANATG